METKDNPQLKKIIHRSGMIHTIISHSYATFFVATVLGIILDMITPVKIFNNILFQYIGFGMIVFGPAITYWAQKSSDSAKKNAISKNLTISFGYGPYRYTRNPSYLGVFIMILGLGLVMNSIFSIIFGIIAYLIVRLIFIKKEENILSDKYGQTYLDYKKKVKNIL